MVRQETDLPILDLLEESKESSSEDSTKGRTKPCTRSASIT